MEVLLINSYGCQNMVDPIRRVLVKHPKDAYQDQIKLNQAVIPTKLFRCS